MCWWPPATHMGRWPATRGHCVIACGSTMRSMWRWLRADGEPPGDVWAALSGNYRTKDGWVLLHCNYPHHADAVCRALNMPHDRAAVSDAVALRTAWDVQEAVIEAGGAAAAMRTR